MNVTCPACNKPGQTEPACPRCGCDLSQLHAILRTATARLADAQTALTRHDCQGALARSEHSWLLLHSAQSAQLAFLAAAALGDTPRALAWRRRALQFSPPATA